MTRRGTETTIAALSALTAASAAGEAVYGLRGAPNVPREWLAGSPFQDYRGPSLVLGIAVGGSSAASAATAWRASDQAGVFAIASGVILTGWIAGQVKVIGPRSFLQPLMACVGIAMIGLGSRLMTAPRSVPMMLHGRSGMPGRA